MKRCIAESPRIRLETFTTADTAFIIRLLNTPGWIKYIGQRHVHTEDDALEYLKRVSWDLYDQNGSGLFKVVLKEIDSPVGITSLLFRDYLPCPDIGYAVLPEYAGSGIATEAARLMLGYAQTALQVKNTCAITLPENSASVSVLQKLGMTPRGEITTPEGETLSLYLLNH